MVGRVSDVIIEMIKYYANDARRVNHFMKVYSFAKSIGELEKIDKKEQVILEIAAVVHDIGIKISEEKYNSSAGKYQEIEGAKVAEEMLINLGIKKDIVDRVCFLVGHHHTYNNIDNIDFSVPGIKDIHYEVSDNAGNVTSDIVYVTVKKVNM